MKITFGTDGWRGVIAQDYTFENVERVAHASAKYFAKQKNAKNGVAIGYDARFLSREFAECAARVLATSGLTVHLANSIVSTPMTSLAVVKNKLAGAVMITASHNPARYNGFKVKGSFGGSALPEDIAKIEKAVPAKYSAKTKSYEDLVKSKKILSLAAKDMYLDYLPTKIDIDAIRKSELRIAYDTMYGAGIYTIEHLLPEAFQLHNVFNPGFDGTNPEPLAQNLKELSREVVTRGMHVGLATDGDADRIGAIDDHGNFIDSQKLICIFLKYLVEERGLTGEVVRSFSVTDMLENMCITLGLRLHTTPIGFKYVTRLMLERDVLIGGEESGGIGMPWHLPERDGIFNGLFLCEIMARRGKRLSELVDELSHEFGEHHYNRIDFHTTDARKKEILKKASAGFKKIAGLHVERTETLDGFKFYVEGGWLMIRASGTEPLLRYYSEANSMEKVSRLLSFAQKL